MKDHYYLIGICHLYAHRQLDQVHHPLLNPGLVRCLTIQTINSTGGITNQQGQRLAQGGKGLQQVINTLTAIGAHPPSSARQ